MFGPQFAEVWDCIYKRNMYLFCFQSMHLQIKIQNITPMVAWFQNKILRKYGLKIQRLLNQPLRASACFCALLCAFSRFCALLCAFVHFCVLLYPFVQFSMLLCAYACLLTFVCLFVPLECLRIKKKDKWSATLGVKFVFSAF